MAATITLDQLRKHGAYCGQLKLFKALFGKVVILKSRDAAVDLATQHEADFNWSWAVERLLASPAKADYQRITAPARADYERVATPAYADYWHIRNTAREESRRTRDPAKAKYERMTAPAWADYRRITAPAREAYRRIRATTFATLYYDQEKT